MQPHVADAPNTERHIRASILWQITSAFDTDSIEAYHRNQFVSRAYPSPISRSRSPRARSLGFPSSRSAAMCGVRVRSGQVRQPTGSLDHMSETNDAHVTRWRHGSRGIAVLSVDCSPNTSAAVAFVLHSDGIPAKLIDPVSLTDPEIEDEPHAFNFFFLRLNLLNYKTLINLFYFNSYVVKSVKKL